MSALVKCFVICVSLTTTDNAVVQIDVSHPLTHCPSDGNLTTVVVICTATGFKDMNIKRNDDDIAHSKADSHAGQSDTFNTNEGHTAKTVVVFKSNVTGDSISVMVVWPVEWSANGFGNVTCIAEDDKKDRILSTTWNIGPSESCKTGGNMTLGYGCYNNEQCIFSCHGDQVLSVSLNGQKLSGDSVNITSSQCYHENNTCSSEVRDFVMIKDGMAIGMVSKLGVLRCVGLYGYVEVNMVKKNMSSTDAPIPLTPTQKATTEQGSSFSEDRLFLAGGHATGVSAKLMTIVAAVTVGWIWQVELLCDMTTKGVHD